MFDLVHAFPLLFVSPFPIGSNILIQVSQIPVKSGVVSIICDRSEYDSFVGHRGRFVSHGLESCGDLLALSGRGKRVEDGSKVSIEVIKKEVCRACGRKRLKNDARNRGTPTCCLEGIKRGKKDYSTKRKSAKKI